MKKLELLGLQPDGRHLTLNDEEGNRYMLAITDELRGALRRDHSRPVAPDQQPRAMSPREIQSYIREGKTIQEVSELASLPPSRIDALAYPILEERRYAADRARALAMGRDTGAMTLEELVTTRLAGRGVQPSDIEWDSRRVAGQPWTLVARYTTAERERTATWHIDFDAQTCDAVDEEAIWLSETPLAAETAWRAPNTPPAPVNPAPIRDIDSPASAPTPAAASAASPEAAEPAAPRAQELAPRPPATSSDARIDAVLASLDSQRGVPAPTPSSAASAEEASEAADVLTLPRRQQASGLGDRAPEEPAQSPATASAPAPSGPADGAGDAKNSAPSAPSAPEAQEAGESETAASGQDALLPAPEPEADPLPKPLKKIRRSNRPSVPTWDEIVFGKKD